MGTPGFVEPTLCILHNAGLLEIGDGQHDGNALIDRAVHDPLIPAAVVVFARKHDLLLQVEQLPEVQRLQILSLAHEAVQGSRPALGQNL